MEAPDDPIQIVRRLFGVLDGSDFVSVRDAIEGASSFTPELAARMGAVGRTIADLIDPEIVVEYHTPVQPVEGSEGRWVGRDAFVSMWANLLSAFDTYRIEPSDFVAVGEDVVVDVVQGGRGRASGLEARFENVQVLTVRQGVVVRIRNYSTRDEAMAAAGAEASA